MSSYELLIPSDHVLVWILNLLLQITFISFLAIMVARCCFRRHPAIRYWLLCSSLLMLLLAPVSTLMMQHSGQSWFCVELADEDNASKVNQESLIQLTDVGPTNLSQGSGHVGELAPSANSASGAEPTLKQSPEPTARPNFEKIPSSVVLATILSPERHGGNAPLINNGGDYRANRLRVFLHSFVLPLAFVWAVGSLLLVTRLVASWIYLSCMLRKAQPSLNVSLLKSYERVIRMMNVTKAPKLLLSERTSGPIATGFRNPRVVLPLQLAEQISSQQLHEVLTHEVAHIVRRDQIIVYLQNLAEAVFWLHPLVWTLNHDLAKAREEVCDNYVLATATAPSYSRTLLDLAERVGNNSPLPGAAGLFTAQWKLEHRIAGLLDETRNLAVRLSMRTMIAIACASLALTTVLALSTLSVATNTALLPFTDNLAVADDEDHDLTTGIKMRGEEANREILVHGTVVGPDGQPANDFELTVRQESQNPKVLTPTVKGSNFEVWVPVGGSGWTSLKLTAKSVVSKHRAFATVQMRALRQAAISGISLALENPDREVRVQVTQNGQPIPHAVVAADLEGSWLMQTNSDEKGSAVFHLQSDEKLNFLSAWTDDRKIGGFAFFRKPTRDPTANEFSIEMTDCRNQKIRLINVADNKPIPKVQFSLEIGTGAPNYNYIGNANFIPDSQMMTDENGEAVHRWFPDWKAHGSYVEIKDSRWAKAAEDNADETVADADGTLVVKLKRRKPRKRFEGQISTDATGDVSGLLVNVRSFQGEEEDMSDHLYAITDADGKFSVDCIPDATYCVNVDDDEFVSNTTDLIPYESVTGQSNPAKLYVTQGEPVVVQLTSGPDNAPICNQWVHLRTPHRYSWRENGKNENGIGGRSWQVQTNDEGLLYTKAPADAKLVVSVYGDDWRSGEQKQTVKKGELTRFEIHRKNTAAREVTGKLSLADGVKTSLANVAITLGAIDGTTDEELVSKTDENGNFSFTTKSLKSGLFAYLENGSAAGVSTSVTFDQPNDLVLKPTVGLQGQLLDKQGEPIADRVIRIFVEVSADAQDRYKKREWFRVKTFKTKTDSLGNYAFTGLPADMPFDVRAVSPENENAVNTLGEFTLSPGEERKPIVSRIRNGPEIDTRTLQEKFQSSLRDSKLGSFHTMVLIYDENNSTFVETHLLDDSTTKQVMSFIQLRVDTEDLTTKANSDFASSQDWPTAQKKTVFASAVDPTGNELGRIEIDLGSTDPGTQAADFINKHAPVQADAEKKWADAFAEAKRSDRKVWARVSQRYCRPCFLFSRWLDDHHELLEQDYVILKFDNVRDLNGQEVVKHLVGNDRFGVPFHAIFDKHEKMLIDSKGPSGNIGHPSGAEAKLHIRKMLDETSKHLTPQQRSEIVESISDD